MRKVLFLPSHIGLGHVTRDYRIYKELMRISKDNIKVEWCSPPPPYIFLKNIDLDSIETCKRLFSMSIMAEEYIDKKLLYRPWTLPRYFKYLHNNYKIIKNVIDAENYDLIVGDETWELVLDGDREILKKTIFLTDIVFLSLTNTIY
jgi:hypothetical protein